MDHQELAALQDDGANGFPGDGASCVWYTLCAVDFSQQAHKKILTLQNNHTVKSQSMISTEIKLLKTILAFNKDGVA
jgi:hypothetical protein